MRPSRGRRCSRRARRGGSARRPARRSRARPPPRTRRRRRGRRSAPSPARAASSLPLLIVVSAPNRRALSSRLSARSIAMICPGVYSLAVRIAARPIGPAPTIATVSPGATMPLSTPTSKEVGRMSARNSTCSSVRLVGDLVDGVVGERHARVLGLQPVDQVTEDPPATTEALPVAAFLAEATAPAGADARHEHAVARSDRGHAGSDLLDGADGLVAEHSCPASSRARRL